MNINLDRLKELLHVIHKDNIVTPNYAVGILVGCVGGLTIMGLTFEEAMKYCSRCAPRLIMIDSVPVEWFGSFGVDQVTIDTGRRTEGIET